MLMLLFAAGLQTATEAWSPSAQGVWRGTASPDLNVSLSSAAATVAMDSSVPLKVALSSSQNAVSVSPMLNVTRGIAYEVRGANGHLVAPKEPIAISPPAPPVGLNGLKMIRSGSPLVAPTAVRAINLFPGPGRYRVRAVIFLMDIEERPARYAKLLSNEVVIDVTP
ncbi:hypothetical protein ACH0BU_18020 [Sphingomonas olei]